jgi:benzoate-CoA ligase family protein
MTPPEPAPATSANRVNAAELFLTRNLGPEHASRVAYAYDDGQLTFENVFDLARRAATLIRASGADEEQRVALFLDDSPDLVTAFWGALWAGCVAVPINRASGDADVDYILRDARARILLTDAAGERRIDRTRLPHLTRVLRTDGAAPFLNAVRAKAPMETAAATHPDEAAFWLYTSGSTGKPKGVLHAHASMAVCAEHYAKETLGLGEGDIAFSIAKIPFAYGLGATLYMPMWVGARAVLTTASNAFDVADVVRRYRPTVLFGIPSIYAELLATAEIAAFSTASLRLCVSAAEPLPVSIFTAFRERFDLAICEGIGTTELLHVFLSNRPHDCQPGSCGRPVPGYEVRVLDAAGQPARPFEVGDLDVRGPSMMLGYWNRRAESQVSMHAGAMRTGDKYVVDDNGNFRFMGRADDLFKVNGQWVVPSEVEAEMCNDERVRECAIVLVRRDASTLPTLLGYVTLHEASAHPEAIAESIRCRAKEALAHFKVPKRIRVLGELPRTPTGKVDRRRLAYEATRDAFVERAKREARETREREAT